MTLASKFISNKLSSILAVLRSLCLDQTANITGVSFAVNFLSVSLLLNVALSTIFFEPSSGITRSCTVEIKLSFRLRR